MLRLLSHMFEIFRARTNVFRGDVFAAKRFDEPAVHTKDCFTIHWPVALHDDRLAAAERHAGQRVLVSHAARQTQQIVNCLLFVLIMPQSRATDGWSKSSVMNSYQAVIMPVDARRESFVPRNG